MCLVLVTTQVGGIHVPDNIAVPTQLDSKSVTTEKKDIFKLANHMENNKETTP